MGTNYLTHTKGFASWAFTLDHKRIALMYLGSVIAFFAIGSDATKKYAPIAAKAGCVVIDNSSLYRYDPAVPLIMFLRNSRWPGASTRRYWRSGVVSRI